MRPEQIERYAPHILLREVGGEGQEKLLHSKVLLIGAGGLGAPAAMYLAAAGIGTIGIVDDDVVSLSNLQRQILFDTDAIGQAKTSSAHKILRRLNPDVNIEAHTTRIHADNALDLIDNYDLVLDGSDNFATRFLVNDACYFARRPLVSAAVGAFEGQLTTIRAYERDADGNPNPCYRCLVPDTTEPETPCEREGILGALTGVMGSMQALEAIKEILGIGTSLVGQLLLYDALDMRIRIIRLRWDPENPLTGSNPTIQDLDAHRA